MSRKGEFDNILDECLERLINGDAIEACLAAYPKHAVELEPLLRTAMDARKAAAIKPRPEFRGRVAYQFQAAIREMESKKTQRFSIWFPRWATVVAAVVVIVLLAGSGTVAAASNSLPDSPLYQVKLATEAVRLALTQSPLGKAELYAKFADERVDEIVRMADKGKVEQVEKATERMNNQLIAMANLALYGEEEAVSAEIAAFEAAPAPAPTPTPALGPAPVPATEPAAEEAPVLMAPSAPGPSEEADKARGRGRVDEVKPDNQAKLRITVSEQAFKNSQKLQELLDRVPASLKPALRRALEVANNGYEQVLRNLD
jgi:hypothetical protein